MSVFSVAMLALGLFLVLYTMVFLLRPAKEGAGNKKDSLGCGFVLLAGLVWSVALSSYLHDRGAGFRLGFGGALILPALVTIFRPGRKRIVPAAVLFVVAIVVASSAFPTLKQRLAPGRRGTTLEKTREEARVLSADITQSTASLAKWKADRSQLIKQIKRKDPQSFDDVTADTELLGLMKELAEIDQVCTKTEQQLQAKQSAFQRKESAVRRIERLKQAAQLSGDAVSETELTAILEEARSPVDEELPSSVESHVERERLKELFNQIRVE